MKVTISEFLDKKSNLVIWGLFENESIQDKELSKELADAAKAKLFAGKFGELYETKTSSGRIIFAGLGKKNELDLEKVRRIFGKVLGKAKCLKANSLETNLSLVIAASGKFNEEQLGMAIAEGLLLGNYDFVKYLSKDKLEKRKPVDFVVLQWKGKSVLFGDGLKKGRVLAESTNFVKDLVNESASIVTSEYLESVARRVAAGNPKIKVTVMDKPQLEKLGMGALLGVNAGSNNPPKLVIIEYQGSDGRQGSSKPIALIGKGITFDSGGYNLKPTKYIEDMKSDMAGAAAALGVLKAAAELGLKKRLIAVMALCENMVSSTAQHPGDIVTAYNGKSIEIGNTDAEGRLVLADALSYVEKKYNPEVIIDLATLTGACVVALGYYAAGMMGKDQKLLEELQKAGDSSGDRAWPLPFYDDFQDWMDGTITDLNNISMKGKGYEAGSITAGVFLSKFIDIKKTRWAHIDIAGSAYWNVSGDYVQKGATGSGVRLLSYWLLGKGKI